LKAVSFNEHGKSEVLRYGDFPDPTVRDDEVLVKVRASSINHLDLWIRAGLRNVAVSLPHILGADISGEISKVGGLVKNISEGDNVIVSPGISCGRCEYCLTGSDNFCSEYSIIGGYDRNGGYAEYVSVPGENIIPKPKNLSFEQAAALPLTFLTAWHMLVGRAKIKMGETVLVVAAGSGVGSAAVQIAKLYGAIVIATTGSNVKAAKAKEAGADFSLDHSRTDYSEKTREITNRKGVDIVIDHVGAATWERSLKSLTHGGRIVTCGATSGADAFTDVRQLYRRQLTILGSFMGSKGELLRLIHFVNEGKLRPIVDSVFPLAEAARAHDLMESRQQYGKIVLSV
jgi:NADPH:quinone reductase-like Zn-dependent oxidoreductase